MGLGKTFQSNQLGGAKQSGSVLLISLMILTILTFVTFSASKNALLQERLTASARENIAVSEAVEMALREAENTIMDQPFVLNGAGGRYLGVVGVAAGASTIPTGLPMCNVNIAGCYLNVWQDLFLEAAWAQAQTTVDTISLGKTDISGEYMSAFLGAKTIALTGAGQIRVDGQAYEGLDQVSTGDVYLFQIAARAKLPTSDVAKVYVSYFAIPIVSGLRPPL